MQQQKPKILINSNSLPKLSSQKSPSSFKIKLYNIPQYIRSNQFTLPSLLAARNALDPLKNSKIKYETLFLYQQDPQNQAKQFILDKNSDQKVKILQGIIDKYMQQRMFFYTPEPNYLSKDYIKQRPYDVSALEKIQTGRKINFHCEQKFGRNKALISRNSLGLEDVMLNRLERISNSDRAWSLTQDQCKQLEL